MIFVDMTTSNRSALIHILASGFHGREHCCCVDTPYGLWESKIYRFDDVPRCRCKMSYYGGDMTTHPVLQSVYRMQLFFVIVRHVHHFLLKWCSLSACLHDVRRAFYFFSEGLLSVCCCHKSFFVLIDFSQSVQRKSWTWWFSICCCKGISHPIVEIVKRRKSKILAEKKALQNCDHWSAMMWSQWDDKMMILNFSFHAKHMRSRENGKYLDMAMTGSVLSKDTNSKQFKVARCANYLNAQHSSEERPAQNIK